MLNVLAALVVSVVTLASTADGATSSSIAQEAESESDMTESAPMPLAEPADPPPGGSEPGAAEFEDSAVGAQPPDSVPVLPAGVTTHVDPIRGFSIDHPGGFLVLPQEASRLSQFHPAPVASIFFTTPIPGAGDRGGMDPPDLEVRVYAAGAALSLESWLASVGFTSAEGGTSTEPCRSARAVGLKVCQSTMIFPGCSCFFLRGGSVFQLTPASLEGEAMVETFTLLP